MTTGLWLCFLKREADMAALFLSAQNTLGFIENLGAEWTRSLRLLPIVRDSEAWRKCPENGDVLCTTKSNDGSS